MNYHNCITFTWYISNHLTEQEMLKNVKIHIGTTLFWFYVIVTQMIKKKKRRQELYPNSGFQNQDKKQQLCPIQ